jgi:hypothetical protein
VAVIVLLRVEHSMVLSVISVFAAELRSIDIFVSVIALKLSLLRSKLALVV